MFEQLLDEMTLLRNGAAIRGDGGPVLRLLKMILLMALRDGASRLHVSRTDDTTAMHVEVNGERFEMVPPPAHVVDELCALLACEPRPWYRRLLRRERPRVPQAWRGWFEVRARGVSIPVDCDILPHARGVLIALDLAATAEHVAMMGLTVGTEER